MKNYTKISSTKTWLLFLFFGWSYGSLGKPMKQILFYLTLGGLGCWTLYKFFTLNRDIKNYNRSEAIKQGATTEDLLILNLF
jgi:hypothetical protein